MLFFLLITGNFCLEDREFAMEINSSSLGEVNVTCKYFFNIKDYINRMKNQNETVCNKRKVIRGGKTGRLSNRSNRQKKTKKWFLKFLHTFRFWFFQCTVLV